MTEVVTPKKRSFGSLALLVFGCAAAAVGCVLEFGLFFGFANSLMSHAMHGFLNGCGLITCGIGGGILFKESFASQDRLTALEVGVAAFLLICVFFGVWEILEWMPHITSTHN
jgi:hypothetical protein